jgi:hypothetical protein
MLASVLPNVRKVKTATAGLKIKEHGFNGLNGLNKRNYDQDDYKQR